MYGHAMQQQQPYGQPQNNGFWPSTGYNVNPNPNPYLNANTNQQLYPPVPPVYPNHGGMYGPGPIVR